MMRKVYKYATGEPIPEGAVYCSTQVEKTVRTFAGQNAVRTESKEDNALVWHYFLVEVEEEEPEPSAYCAGIWQGDGDDVPENVKQGDLYIFLRDNKQNRHLQCDLLKK